MRVNEITALFRKAEAENRQFLFEYEVYGLIRALGAPLEVHPLPDLAHLTVKLDLLILAVGAARMTVLM